VTGVPVKVGLTVTIPGAGNVTGQAFGGVAGSFNGDAFLFVSEDGTISGWRGALGTTAEVLQLGDPTNVYKGTADANIGGNLYLYSANFRTSAIDVFKGNAGAPNLTGNFLRPEPSVRVRAVRHRQPRRNDLCDHAVQDGAKEDDVAGAGNGIVDACDLQGNFLRRVGTGGALNSPWGLAIAPTRSAEFAGDLLVGNFGDGRINIYNPTSGAFIGQVDGLDGSPIAIDGLWGLTPETAAGRQPAVDLFQRGSWRRGPRSVRRHRGRPGTRCPRAARTRLRRASAGRRRKRALE
jgi:uncharacterized protein (TIGR03118 family)